jgi:hypothetical protein
MMLEYQKTEDYKDRLCLIKGLRDELSVAHRRKIAQAHADVVAVEKLLAEAKRELVEAEMAFYDSDREERQGQGPVELMAVCVEFDVTPGRVMRRGRGSPTEYAARHELMRRLREHGWLLKEIGLFVGGRDHATCIHGIRRANERLSAGVR